MPKRRAFETGLIVALMLTSVAAPARAEPSAVRETQRVGELMMQYYDGERAGGISFLAAGLIHAGVASYLLAQDHELSRAASYPLFATGALQLLVGILVTATNHRHVTERRTHIARDVEEFRRTELDRLDGVMTTFTWAQAIELTLIAVGIGLAIYGELDDQRTIAGLGVGLAAGCALGWTLEFLATQRALSYRASLRRGLNVAPLQDGVVATWRQSF